MMSEAEKRHERLMWGEAAYPTPIIAVISVEHAGKLEEGIADVQAKLDDVFWTKFIALPFSWPRFHTWWVARRWVIPRDIRKEQ